MYSWLYCQLMKSKLKDSCFVFLYLRFLKWLRVRLQNRKYKYRKRKYNHNIDPLKQNWPVVFQFQIKCISDYYFLQYYFPLSVPVLCQ